MEPEEPTLVWIVFKNGNYWGSQRVVAVCLTKELAMEFVRKREEIRDDRDRTLYGFHVERVEVLKQINGETQEIDLRGSKPTDEVPGLLF